MKCNNCGAEVMNGSQFCQNCGATVLSQPSQQPMQGSYQQPMQQGYNPQQPMQMGYNNQQQNSYQNRYVSSEDAHWALKVLSLIIPIAGFVLWLVKKDKEPVAAKSCLIWAAAGVALNILWAFIW